MWITSSHRGLVTEGLHQNTMAAYYNSYLNGAEMIEMDARMTADGILVSNHDAEAVGMDPATGETVKLEVAEHTAEEICALILSDDPRWGAQHVPTLEAVLDLCYRTGMDVNIDMKNAGTYVHEICRLVWNMGMRGHSILLFFANELQNPFFAKKSSVSAFCFLQMSFKTPLCKKIFRFSLLFFADELQNPLFAKILRLVPHCANLVPFPPASPNLSPAKKGL